MTLMIHWCELCNEAPAQGILAVVRKGETQQSYMHACNDCVEKLQPEDWIQNDLC